MKNILIIGQKSKLAFENLKKINHKKINKTLDDYIKLISINKKKIIREKIMELLTNLTYTSIYTKWLKFNKIRFVSRFFIVYVPGLIIIFAPRIPVVVDAFLLVKASVASELKVISLPWYIFINPGVILCLFLHNLRIGTYSINNTFSP